ncbi:MAG: Fe-S protein, homolog of lactate dehydrogenase SO1521, partial [uncultured Rubrobacteraceae bacterium]
IPRVAAGGWSGRDSALQRHLERVPAARGRLGRGPPLRRRRREGAAPRGRLLRPPDALGGPRRAGPQERPPQPRSPHAPRRARRPPRRPGAELHPHDARRLQEAPARRQARRETRCGDPPLRGGGSRARCRPLTNRGLPRAAARSLPPEGAGRYGSDGEGARARAGDGGYGGRLRVLRDGRALRLREGPLRRLDEDGGQAALPRRQGGGGERCRGAGDELQGADPGRHRPPRPPPGRVPGQPPERL